jgi:hypothetical protein
LRVARGKVQQANYSLDDREWIIRFNAARALSGIRMPEAMQAVPALLLATDDRDADGYTTIRG